MVLIFGAIALVAATIVVIATPIIQKDSVTDEPIAVDLTLASLEEEKEGAYNALKEAEFDYQTGKLSDEDYGAIKKKYSAIAVETMRKLEEHGKSVSREQGAVSREDGQGTKTNFCSGCGNRVEKGASFCPSCGQKLV